MRQSLRAAVRGTCVGLAILGWLSTGAIAQHAGHGAMAPAASGVMRTPTAVFDPSGRLWRVWVQDDRILVSSSTDRGATYGPAVTVTPAPEPVDANGESRPKIALGPSGEIFVSWTREGAKAYTGDIRFSRSVDDGRTFSPPRTINDDGLSTGHRFDALAAAPDGTVYLVWIDKRDLVGATATQQAYEGAALYYAVSRDRGRTFAPNGKIKDHICECCRIAHAFDAEGHLVLFWRDVMTGSIRDHAMVRLSPTGPAGPVRRVTADNWAIDACPHHGPWLAMGGDGTMHITWFTGEGKWGPGAFYGRLSPEGRLVGTPVRLGSARPTTGHAVVVAAGSRVLVAWKEARRPAGAVVMLIESNDGGRTFAKPREIARTTAASDHPFLLDEGASVYLSWWSEGEGHTLRQVASN